MARAGKGSRQAATAASARSFGGCEGERGGRKNGRRASQDIRPNRSRPFRRIVVSNLLVPLNDWVYRQIMRQAVRLVCVVFMVLAVTVGPCQVCFDGLPGRSQHSCCPVKNPTPCHGQSPARNHQHTASCADVHVAVDPLKGSVILFEAAVPQLGWIVPEPAFQHVPSAVPVDLLILPLVSSVLRC